MTRSKALLVPIDVTRHFAYSPDLGPTAVRSPGVRTLRPRHRVACDAAGMTSSLPEGWTIERVRTVSGDDSAAVSPTERLVLVEVWAEHQSAHEPVPADQVGTIIQFHGLYLVSIEGEWYMGILQPDGSITCWGSYGTDLQEALRSL